MANKICLFTLNWVWQFPQMLLGKILIRLTKAEKTVFKTSNGREIVYYLFERNTAFNRFISGIGLVDILLHSGNNDELAILHEYGHTLQSRYLGWLYLPVVGVYSAVFCSLWDGALHKSWNVYDRLYWYFLTRWTERWADRLGNVERKKNLAQIPRPANARYPAMENQRTA